MIVGIQETEHFEGVYPVIRLFDNGRNQLFIFVNREVYERLADLLGTDTSKFHWVIQEEQESTLVFCQRIRKTILQNRVQLVYLNTVSKHHLWYALLLPFRKIGYSILTVHDVNCLFKDKPGLSPRSWLKWIGKRLLTRRVNAFNTVSDTVVPYLRQQARQKQPVHAIPGAVYEQEKAAPMLSDEIRIVVPGSIDSRRRDYHAVLKLAALVKAHPVHICLLGGGNTAYAKDIWQQCRLAGNSRLTWYETEVVSQAEFDRQLDAAHFIWVPSVVKTTICGNIPETYGITKSSGNIFDIIKHARPFFAPESLVIPEVLQDSCKKYSELGELAEQINILRNNPAAYAKLAGAAREASAAFTVENLRMHHAPLFDRVPDRTGPNAP